MNGYLILIFLHVLGAVSMFAAWGIEAVTVRQLRQAATTGDATVTYHLLKKHRPMGPIAMLTVLGTGIWMMIARWGPQPWMTAALATVVAIIVLSVVLARRSMPRLEAALDDAPAGLPTRFAALTGWLTVSLQLRTALGVGILGLMTMKPGVPGTLVIMGVAVVVGLGATIRSMNMLDEIP